MDGGVLFSGKFISMKELVSKLSLYDILAMVIPGGTILIYVNTAFGYTFLKEAYFVVHFVLDVQ